MNQSVIESRIIKTEPVKWRELQFIQQEDFKEWLPNGDKKKIKENYPELNLGELEDTPEVI